MAFLTKAANRGSISTGYTIENSLKLEPDNGERFDTGDKFTNYSSVRKFTVSGWFKRTELSVQSLIWFNVNTATSVNLQFEAGDFLSILFQDNVGNGVESYAKTSALFRDTSAWYHVVLAVDTTQGTAADRTKIYVNGVNQTLVQANGSYDTFPAQNYNVPLQTRHYLFGYDGSNNGFRGYAAEFYFLDGITASPTDFGEFDITSGIWKPIEYTGGFGNEGYYLDFEDASALGKDVSSNNQGNFSHYGGSAADQAVDTPTNNFCTWLSNGQLFHPTSAADNPTFNEGGTRQIGNGGTGWVYAYATQAASSGKWYYEGIVGSAKNCMIGACPVSTTARSTNAYLGQESNSTVGFQYSDGNIFFYTGYTTWESGGLATGDIVGFAMDLDNGKAYVSRNGVWFDSANPATNSRGLTVSAMTQEPYMFAMARYNPNENNPFNFGGFTTISISTPESDENGYGNFEYAPPSGFYAMCTKNLAEYG